jgi:Domain of unknown function (DUF4249)
MTLIKYFSGIIFFFIFASCNNSEDIFSPIVDIKLPDFKSKLVIFANFKTDSDTLKVYLTRTRSALDTSVRKVFIRNDTFGIFNGKPLFQSIFYEGDTLQNAKVELFRNNVLFGTFKNNALGLYILPKKLVADGATYRIRAEVAGYEVVEATQKIPTPAKLDSVRYVENGAVVQEDIITRKSNEYVYFFTDPTEGGNYYYIKAEHFDTSFSFNGSILFYPQSLDKLEQSGFLNDKSFNGKPYNWRNYNDQAIKPLKGSRIEYTLFTTTVDLFQFSRSKQLNEDAKGNPFAEPVILYSNIKNGYGIFTLTGTSTWIKRL